jgi:hypothetical protein
MTSHHSLLDKQTGISESPEDRVQLLRRLVANLSDEGIVPMNQPMVHGSDSRLGSERSQFGSLKLYSK